MKTQLRYLECDGVQVVVSIETQKCEEHPILLPKQHVILYSTGATQFKIRTRTYYYPKWLICISKKTYYWQVFQNLGKT